MLRRRRQPATLAAYLATIELRCENAPAFPLAGFPIALGSDLLAEVALHGPREGVALGRSNALLGLSSMQNSLAVLDLRKDKLHMWTSSNPDDIEIRVKPGREQNVAKLQITKAPSGHLILKCTD